MSAFSRGLAGFLHHRSICLPSSIRATLFAPRHQLVLQRSESRLFFSSTSRQYARGPGVGSAPRYPTSSRNFMLNDPVLREVELLKKPVLIYKAPRRLLRNLTTYGLACTLVGGGLWTLQWRYELPKDLPYFVGPTYVLVAFIMLAIAGYIFSAPVGRCSSIEVIPTLRGPTQLRIRAKIVPFPYPPEREIIVNLANVTLSEKTGQIVAELKEADRARRQNISEGLEGMFITRRGWELLARFIEQKWTSFFLMFKFNVLRFGIVRIEVNDQKWKVDCSGYMLEEGRAIDRLIPET
ncbi:hypothetical protein BDV96DRAFT_584478 [Lophiotrema nucula]|uniref:Uncharacterized protein n=1 Tax=Lophiotrema nucula TaxID=690887 RepID=A0A6A5YUF7_9PLEO|nr:hypothetical protein BDV96DRAFT_584478 [Lophiotrema nucula]